MSIYTQTALEVITCFDKAVKELLGRAYKSKAIASRLSDFPALAATSGIMPALTFYLSKAVDEEEAFTATYRLIKTAECRFTGERLSNIKKYFEKVEGSGGEGKGYGVALALILASLEKIEYLRICNKEPGIREVADALLNVERGCSKAAEEEALQVITELKKLGTAFYKT